MKTKIAMIAFMAISFVVTAQNDYLTGQTKLVNPNPSGRTLLLEKNDGDSWLTFHDNGNAWYSMGIDQSNTNNFSLNYGGSLTSSQFVMTRDGKVGIGTNIPRSRLDIGTRLGANNGLRIGDYIEINERETINNAGVIGFNANISGEDVSKFKPLWTGSSAASGIVMSMTSGGNSDLTFYGYKWGRDATPRSLNEFTKILHLSTIGKVGIGTASPTQSLDVNGHVKFDALNSTYTNLQIGHGANDRIFADNHPNETYGGGMFFRVTSDPSLNIPHNYIDVMMLTDEGNVGIGISDTKGFKLGVNGKIAATEVKVATYANWPDYVFEESYTLPTLKEVEDYIKTKGHLENIPSAKEVEKNGVLLGEMNKNLLQKIEELTLYTIQQEKEIEKLKEKNKEIKFLSERLTKLEKLLKKQ